MNCETFRVAAIRLSRTNSSQTNTSNSNEKRHISSCWWPTCVLKLPVVGCFADLSIVAYLSIISLCSKKMSIFRVSNIVDSREIMVRQCRRTTSPTSHKLMHHIPSIKRWAYREIACTESARIRPKSCHVTNTPQQICLLTRLWSLGREQSHETSVIAV